ncbi:hypothetical protein [Rhizobium sp. YTU87027]|uniref:hypothetical protein n=1 Tax=Rhizobium sp. YTU87027 TaxID=3417741 RepID=UPI003D696BF5
MTDVDYAETFLPDDLTNAIVELLYTAEEEAKILASARKIPYWRALAIVWYKKCKKRRQPAVKAA